MYAEGARLGSTVEGPAEDRPARGLDRLEDLAGFAERTGDVLERAIARYHGASARVEKDKPQAVPSGHMGQMNRLGEALDRLYSLANDIEQII